MPVYFIQAGEGGPVKIGWAIDPVLRLAEFQTAHYETLTLLRVIAGDRAIESWLHRQFRVLRVRGEWFRFDPALLAIEPVISGGAAPRVFVEADETPWDFIERFARENGVEEEAIRKWRVRGVPHRWRLPIASAAGPGFDVDIFDLPPGPRRAPSSEAA